MAPYMSNAACENMLHLPARFEGREMDAPFHALSVYPILDVTT